MSKNTLSICCNAEVSYLEPCEDCKENGRIDCDLSVYGVCSKCGEINKVENEFEKNEIKASYRGYINIIDSWSSSNKQEAKFLKKILGETKKIGLRHLISKKRLISAMSNMWEISQRFWSKFVDDNDNGFEEFEVIHWINHDFLVILNPEAFDIEGHIENGIVNKKMFDIPSPSIYEF